MEGIQKDFEEVDQVEEKNQLEKKQQIQQKLNLANEKRLQKLKDKKESEDQEKALDEDWFQIDQKFTQEYTQLEMALIEFSENHKNIQKDEIEMQLSNIFDLYKDLREYVNNYTFAIPSTYFSQYQIKLQSFVEAYNIQKDIAIPKKKFSFQKKDQNVKKMEKKEVNSQTDQGQIQVPQGNNLYLMNLENEFNMIVQQQQYEGKQSLVLENVKNCNIYVPFSIKNSFMKNLQNCKIVIKAVQGSCFVNQAEKCEFYFTAQQIRIHNSKNCKFILLSKSNPIIEHSNELLFGDLTLSEYAQDYQEFWKENRFDLKKNLWNQVQDFNWLKQDHSPNWGII